MFSWPELPKSSPGHLRDKLLVAWVAYRAEEGRLFRGKAESQVSILFLHLIFRYVSASAAETALKRLRKPLTPKTGAWLILTTRARGRFGHHYKPGKLAQKELLAWQTAGELLFGPGGALEPYRCRPIFSNSGIGPYGCIVLALIERCGPLTALEVESLLSSYMSRKSIQRHLGYVKGWDLIKLSRDKYYVTRGLSKKVDKLEIDLGAASKMLKVDNERDRQWIEYQTEILGKPEILLLKAVIRKLSCFYCTASPSPTGGEVEHFPPIHWGGSDETSLLLPICRSCNGNHGNRIRGSKQATLKARTEPLTIQMAGTPEETVEHFMLVMLYNNFSYATAMNENKVDEARDFALSAYEIWAAIKGHGAGIKFVDTITGEISKAGKTESHVSLHQYLADYQGIPELLAPLKRKRI